jgi:ABC-2 type transport system ATP-binding protein
MSFSIETYDLTRIFKSKQSGRINIVKALDNVNLKVSKGELFGLLGPNGAGKTTLIKILCTLLFPTSGKAYVNGYDILKDTSKIREIINVASGGETPGYGILTVKENLWFFSQLYGIPNRIAKERINELLEIVDLKDKTNERLNKLSSGMKQKLNIARSLLNDPQILFLDEPTLGLDVISAHQIREYIKFWIKEKENRTVFLTTHYMAEAEELCDRVAIIDEGKIIACDTPGNLKKMVSKGASFEIEIAYINDEKINLLKSLKGIIALSFNHKIDENSTIIKIIVENESIISDIISMILNLKSKVISLKKIEPTLETVFMSLVGKGLEND